MQKIKQLAEVEAKIENGIQNLFTTGKALMEIRDRQGYTHDGFDDFYVYCKQKHGMEKAEVDWAIGLADGSIIDLSTFPLRIQK